MYSIPLRRALVTDSDLPYPEGTACAEVIKVGTRRRCGQGFGGIRRQGPESGAGGSLVSALFLVMVQMRLFLGDVAHSFRLGSDPRARPPASISSSLRAVSALATWWASAAASPCSSAPSIGWGWGAALQRALPAAGDAGEFAHATWSHYVRYVGAGAIAVSAIWTLFKLVKPVIGGLKSAIFPPGRARPAKGPLPRTEHDIPVDQVGLVVAALHPADLLAVVELREGCGPGRACAAPHRRRISSWWSSGSCFNGVRLHGGLIGASNSPLSGIGILVVATTALFLVVSVKSSLPQRWARR